MEDVELTNLLAKAGLVYSDRVDLSAPIIPPRLAGFANSCPTEDVAFAEAVEVDDPDLVSKVNAAWYQVSCEGGLFSSDGSKFLLAVDLGEVGADRIPWWAKVVLAKDWDLADAGAASGALGTRAGHPSFVMLSLDGKVIVRVDRGERWVDIVAVRDAHRIDLFKRRGERMVGSHRTDSFTRAAIKRWLVAVSN